MISFADLTISEVHAQLATVTIILIEKGIVSVDEFEAKRDEVKKMMADPETIRLITEEWTKRHGGEL